MAKKKVTLFVDSGVYEKFKKVCDKKGWIISKQFENFMEKEVKEDGK